MAAGTAPRLGLHALLVLAATALLLTPAPGSARTVDAELAERFAGMALACADKEFPNFIQHIMADAREAGAPRDLTPAFYGCFDWHSAVHGHWLLARLARLHPGAEFQSPARAMLDRNLGEAALLREAAYMAHPLRGGFERPYGYAWLLQLATELQQWEDDDAKRWRKHLRPLEAVIVKRLGEWLPNLEYPLRSGEHYQSAFAFGLILDYARAVEDPDLAELITDAGRRFYLNDRNCPLGYEPSGHDFFSPCLAEADFMRRLMPPREFAIWLEDFLPAIGTDGWLPLATVTDRSDGKLSHIDGLNISRAWMLEGISAALPPEDPRRAALLQSAAEHGRAGVAGVSDEYYAGSHWLASFATYLLTGRGLP